MVRTHLVSTIMSLRLLSPRLLIAKFRGAQRNLTVYVAHAPHSDADPNDRIDFYTTFSEALSDHNEMDTKVVLMDANTGPGEWRAGRSHIVGPHSIPYAKKNLVHMLHPLQSVISRNLLWPLLPPCSEIETERASARVGAFARKGKINRFHRVQALSKLCFWLAGPSFSSEVWSSPFPRGASFPPSSPGLTVCCPRPSLLLAFAVLPFSSQLGLSLFRWLPPPYRFPPRLMNPCPTQPRPLFGHL